MGKKGKITVNLEKENYILELEKQRVRRELDISKQSLINEILSQPKEQIKNTELSTKKYTLCQRLKNVLWLR
jgi:serine phosphatase RsbU (regulator of sigma subunit)